MVWSAAVAVITRHGCFGPACNAGTGSRHHGPFGIKFLVRTDRGVTLPRSLPAATGTRRAVRRDVRRATRYAPNVSASWFYGTLIHLLWVMLGVPAALMMGW
jgi:hypothetical protein